MPRRLLVLSAATEAALEAMTDRLADHLARHPELDLADVAFTLQTGRRIATIQRGAPAPRTKPTRRRSPPRRPSPGRAWAARDALHGITPLSRLNDPSRRPAPQDIGAAGRPGRRRGTFASGTVPRPAAE